jgi:indole-3-glycerol phosphate synthase / phosphoribosylanthranilate isomerase
MAESVLDRILEQKRRDVAQRLAGASLQAEPTRRSLAGALARPGARFIMEVKKASPSGHRSAIEVEAAVRAYAPVADAISVLTDAPFFGGSLEDLRTARAGFDGPILAKDFIVDPAQVVEARAAGADAVLAIMAALDDGTAGAVLAEARRLNMDVLVEVHDEPELKRALALGARIVGINNRDLKTLRIDLATTERLAPMIPPDVLVVSESGVRSRQDVLRLQHHADAFLVGSSLMAAEDIAAAARLLVHGAVKLCGLTNSADVQLAAAAGATHAGFIFVPGTPRHVSRAEPLVREAQALGLAAVGVFRDQDADTVRAIAAPLGLAAVQLHGAAVEPSAIRQALPSGCEIWSVSAVGEKAEPPRPGADRILFDTRVGGSSGGSGVAFDWSLVAGHPDLHSAFLAGGIGPENARAAQQVGAFGLDLCSGVEASPGRKDPERVRAVFDALRPSSRGSVRCN